MSIQQSGLATERGPSISDLPRRTELPIGQKTMDVWINTQWHQTFCNHTDATAENRHKRLLFPKHDYRVFIFENSNLPRYMGLETGGSAPMTLVVGYGRLEYVGKPQMFPFRRSTTTLP
jgi:hypothetical protein